MKKVSVKKALKDAIDMIIWMSGSADFGVGGKARRGG